MIRHHRTLFPALAVLPAVLAGCALLSSSRGGPGQVGDLVGWTERLYVEAEVSRKHARDGLDRLRVITATDFAGDPVQAHAEFVAAIEASEQQAESLRETIEPMKQAADPVFDQWAIDLEAYSNRSMRERSRARMASTRARYDAVVDAADPAQVAFDEFNRGLRDHALYLANDFNPDAVASIEQDVQAMVRLAAEVDAKLAASMETSRAYVVAAAPPSREPSPVDGNGDGEVDGNGGGDGNDPSGNGNDNDNGDHAGDGTPSPTAEAVDKSPAED